MASPAPAPKPPPSPAPPSTGKPPKGSRASNASAASAASAASGSSAVSSMTPLDAPEKKPKKLTINDKTKLIGPHERYTERVHSVMTGAFTVPVPGTGNDTIKGWTDREHYAPDSTYMQRIINIIKAGTDNPFNVEEQLFNDPEFLAEFMTPIIAKYKAAALKKVLPAIKELVKMGIIAVPGVTAACIASYSMEDDFAKVTVTADALPIGKTLGFSNVSTGGWLTLCYGCAGKDGMPIPGTSVDVHGNNWGSYGEGSFAVLKLNSGQVALKNMLDYSWLGVDSNGTVVSNNTGNPTSAEAWLAVPVDPDDPTVIGLQNVQTNSFMTYNSTTGRIDTNSAGSGTGYIPATWVVHAQ